MPVPMRVRSGRPFVDLHFEGPGGSVTACTWVDMGGGSLFVCEDVASRLGVEWEMLPDTGEGEFGKPLHPISVTNLPVVPLPDRTLIKPGALFQPGYPATAFLPARAVLGRDVLFDYPGGEFDVAAAGSMKRRGDEHPAPRHPQSGFPRVELEIDGERLGFLLDTGATYTMVSSAVMDRWLERHPEWPSTFGGSRDASFGYARTDLQRLVRVPEVRWGSSTLRGVGMIARREGTFENYISSMTTAPIVGALAGNVLSCFRLQLGDDVLLAEQRREVDTHELDGVGLSIGADKRGEFTVLGVCEAAHDATKRLLQKGDVLLAVDGQPVTGLLAHDVALLLGGPPGEARTLVLRRGTADISVQVPTAAILSS